MKPREMKGIPATAADKKVESSVDKLLRAQIVFNGDLPARELFASENEVALLVRTKEVQSRRAGLNAGAARNIALKELWSEADQEVWEKQAEGLAGDIHMYAILLVYDWRVSYSAQVTKNNSLC
jgi:hypothetical protein